jgi:FAD/FMN-containing dehydrogenase
VGGGALWTAVDEEAGKYGLATVGGVVNPAGAGESVEGGEYGWLNAKYALMIDVLVKAEVVLANGEILVCNKSQNTDLFRAIQSNCHIIIMLLHILISM